MDTVKKIYLVWDEEGCYDEPKVFLDPDKAIHAVGEGYRLQVKMLDLEELANKTNKDSE